MNRWLGALPWALAAVLATSCLVVLGVLAIDPAPRAAQTMLQARAAQTPQPTPTGTTSWSSSSSSSVSSFSERESIGPSPGPSPGASPNGPPGGSPSGQSRTSPRPNVAPSPGNTPDVTRFPTTLTPPLGRLPANLPGSLCVPVPRLTPLRVLSFNIHGGIGRAGLDLARIVEEIRLSEADVVMLQEVDRFRPRSGNIDMPAWLGEQLGMHHAFAPNVRYGGRAEYGVATLSRYPITETEHVLLPNSAGKEQRGVLRTRIGVEQDEIDVLNTHFEHTSDALRQQQAVAVRALVERGGEPIILGGDFNATPVTVPYATITSALSDSWATVGLGRGPTAGRNGGARIDYVFLEESVIPRAARVLPSAVSDHQAVSVDVLLTGLTTCP